ncbi:amino acid permease-like protein [Amylocarpus encephaloides]|uniref:Amino acid permease-like protein n=1 Tax=Amylocarpus encephaloides TaxID=45428 RepID=A0A9P7YUP5_9HELO|nr:amino acid permease-like protein [Amylocarpus encephaloides]
MSTSPEQPDRDFEKGQVTNHETIQYASEKNGPTFASEENLAESEVLEFGETKHLRHIQMIALAGTIGTGLFLGSGKHSPEGGPWEHCVVLSIAELSALFPLSGAVIRHAEYFVDPALSFAQGWNAIYSYMVSLPAEIVAEAVIVELWTMKINAAVWITIFGFLLTVSNILFVRVYGELELTFASLKIMLIIGLNIMALVITCGGGPDGHTYGFEYWRNPGPFVDYLGYTGALGQFLGFYTTFFIAVYTYARIENISLAAAETQNPRRNIPIAAKRIFWRVTIFYMLSIFMVGLIVPSNDPDLLRSTGTAAQSPFVIAATRAGVKVVPSIINFVVLTSAWSSGKSGLLGASRVLYGMAREGHAPKIFLRVSRMGIPYVAVLFMSLFICLGFMTISDSAATVFGWSQDLVSVASLVNWIIICTVYLRFYYAMKKQGLDRNDLPWKAPFQPYAAWTSVISFSILLLTGGYVTFIHGQWNTETFVSSYINIPIILTLYIVYKFVRKTKIIPLHDLPIKHFMDVAAANPEPPPKPVVGWRRLNILWS